jgi:hypothetical protein
MIDSPDGTLSNLRIQPAMLKFYEARDSLEARQLVDALAAHRIEATILGEYLGGAAGELPAFNFPWVWLINNRDLGEAQEVLDGFPRQPGQPAEGGTLGLRALRSRGRCRLRYLLAMCFAEKVSDHFSARVLAWFERHGRTTCPGSRRRTLPRLGLGDHAAADPGGHGDPLFRALHGALPDVHALATRPSTRCCTTGPGWATTPARATCTGPPGNSSASTRPLSRAPSRLSGPARDRPLDRRRHPVAGAGPAHRHPRRQRQAGAQPGISPSPAGPARLASSHGSGNCRKQLTPAT